MSRHARVALPMVGRKADEAHRTATPLELFFDLVFVVAVAQVSAQLHYGLLHGDTGQTVFRYVFVFGAIWWAWMGFTWFASAFDTDDVVYRLTVFVQLTGALVLAAGVTRAFADNDWVIVLLGYVIMRLAVVSQWLRVARSAPPFRAAALRYVTAISVSQLLWVGLILWSPSWFFVGFVVLFALELAIPPWAESVSVTPWHPEHIVERYGLFTIIVLGEAILSASLAVTVLTIEGLSATLISILVGGLVSVFVLWWLYFFEPADDLLRRGLRTGFSWAYGHLVIWASAAAVGAGLAVAIEQAAGLTELTAVAAGYAVCLPVALYVATSWLLHRLPRLVRWTDAVPVTLAVGALLLVPLTGWAVPLCGAVLSLLLGQRLVSRWFDENAPMTAAPGEH